jgi:hypothetical protein
MTLLYELCLWLNDLPPSLALRESDWAFPIIESVHVLSLGLMVGTVVLVDLRVLGLALPAISTDDATRKLLPITWIGFALMLATGLALFASEAAKLYDNDIFRLKLALLIAAGSNAAWFHLNATRADGVTRTAQTTSIARLSAGASILIWVAIIVCGRLIAYSH